MFNHKTKSGFKSPTSVALHHPTSNPSAELNVTPEYEYRSTFFSTNDSVETKTTLQTNRFKNAS